MKKIMTGAMLATFALSGVIPINAMNSQKIYAEEAQNNIVLSTS